MGRDVGAALRETWGPFPFLPMTLLQRNVSRYFARPKWEERMTALLVYVVGVLVTYWLTPVQVEGEELPAPERWALGFAWPVLFVCFASLLVMVASVFTIVGIIVVPKAVRLYRENR